MWERLIANWVYGGFLAGVLLLLLTPVIARSWSTVLTATFLLLPVYMIHQYEEHDDDRFRRFFNQTVGQGKEVLSPRAVFVINIPGVWGVIAISLWLTAFVAAEYALIAVYVVLVNAVVHVVGVAVFHGYNPGLGTAIALFFPAGAYALWEVQKSGGASLGTHAIALLIAIGTHAAIVLYAKHKQATAKVA